MLACWRYRLPWWLLLGGLLAAPLGCTRTQYRLAANDEVRQIVREHSLDPRWGLPRFHIAANPRARYFDPTNPDHPPMPGDDPVSHRYMHWVDGMHGSFLWDVDGFREELVNPSWQWRLAEYVPLTPTGDVKLDLDAAMTLAQMHSPDYRQQIETLYLSALDVSTERFRFDTQFFGTVLPAFTHSGRLRTAAGEANRLAVNSNLQGVRRRFAAGGEAVVGLANSMVWQFAGPDTHANVSILNFSLVQPLLRGGGRAVALEQLTIVERAMVANLRAFERYRQGFYTRVAIGDQGTQGPQRRGGFFGGTGLTGFTGQGAGGFGGVGSATNFGRGGGNNLATTGGGSGSGFAGGGAGTLEGFVGLLQQLQQIRNSQDSLDAQLRTLDLLEANLDAGLIDLTQVDQFRQSIETDRALLLQQRISLENQLDSFKRQTMGLPPDLAVELDDSMIRQFQFIAPETTALQGRLAELTTELGNLPRAPEAEALRAALEQLGTLRADVGRTLDTVRGDLERMQGARDRRERGLSDEERQQLAGELEKLAETFAELESRYAAGEATLERLAADVDARPAAEAADALVGATTDLAGLLQEIALVQARARVEAITVEPVNLDPHVALEIARANRLDWMNNRADLVDTWRLIRFNANALLSTLDIHFEGDLSTVGDNPVKFRAPTGQLRASLEFDAPFTRLLERNNYCQVLIDYQRDRRQLIQYEDAVHQTMRVLLRQLEQLEINLEIQRRAVVIAARRVDQTREVLNQPPDVAAGQAQQLGPTAALNLLTALSDLRNSQNNFMSVWLNYYGTRMILVRELGLMELDDRGMWIDRPLDELLATCSREVVPLPPAVPDAWIDELDGERLPAGASPEPAPARPAGPERLPVPGAADEPRADDELSTGDELAESASRAAAQPTSTDPLALPAFPETATPEAPRLLAPPRLRLGADEE